MYSLGHFLIICHAINLSFYYEWAGSCKTSISIWVLTSEIWNTDHETLIKLTYDVFEPDGDDDPVDELENGVEGLADRVVPLHVRSADGPGVNAGIVHVWKDHNKSFTHENNGK